MADESKPSEKKGSLMGQIIASVAVAILVGGTSPWWFNAFFSKPAPPSNSPDATLSHPAAISNPPEPSLVASSEFFVGRWRVDEDLGTSIRNVVDYYGNGRFEGKQIEVSGDRGKATPESGKWEVDKISDRTFLLKLRYDDATPPWQGTYKIIDRNHIQNIDQNYVAERVE